jgi:hypothetical protein
VAIPKERARTHLARQVGTLALSHVMVDSPMALVRAAAWTNALGRLGVHLPLFVVHDLGVLLTTPRGGAGLGLGPRRATLNRIAPPTMARPLLEQYDELIRKIATSEVVERLASLRLRDELIGVLLLRALGDTYQRWHDPAKAAGAEELPLDLGIYADVDPAEHFRDFDARPLWGFLEHLATHALHVYTSIELIDLDTVKLLGLFKEDSASGSSALGGAVDLVDLFAALGSPEASDVSHFTLDLIPSVLETKRAAGAQTFAVDGYTSVERKGNVDSLVLSELAYDQDMFEQKVIDQELLYYGHERQREEERRLMYILVDSSASMRGKRQVFARGLALALVKKLSLAGDEIWLRFFDSRLHETIKVGRGGAFPVPYVLSFRSEHGRNYAKVFRQLLLEVTRLRREHRRRIVVYIITHGQAHLAPDLVAALAQQAFLYGIIILPSSQVTLDYLPLLQRHQVVSDEALASRSGRRERALDIVGEAGGGEREKERARGGAEKSAVDGAPVEARGASARSERVGRGGA